MRTYPGIFSSAMLSTPAGYNPAGVTWNGSVSLVNPSLVCTDSPYVYGSFWFQSVTNPFNYAVFGVTDPEDFYQNWIALSTNNGKFDGEFFGPDTDDPPFNDALDWDQTVPLVYGATWHHVLWACKTDRAPTTQFFKIYIDDVDRTVISYQFDPFIPAYNGLAYWVGDDSFGDSITGNTSDYCLTHGQNLFDGTGAIPAVTRRLFSTADNKPVDPSGFPGTPTILFSGNGATYGNNQGTGGAFTHNGPAFATVPGPGAP